MLKQLFQILYKMISRPAKGWSERAEEKPSGNEVFFKTYLYPLIGIIALLTFIGGFFTEKEFNLEAALRYTINITVTLFLGFYLASFLLSEWISRYLGLSKQPERCRRFVGYSSSLIYVLYLIKALLPHLFFLDLFLLYTVYIIWEGAGIYLKIDEKKKLSFTIGASLIILLSPYLIRLILFLTMPGMR